MVRRTPALRHRVAGRAAPVSWYERLLVHPADVAVAAAGRVFQSRAIQHLDAAAAVADEATLLQERGRLVHGGAPLSEHFGEEVLGQLELVAVHPVVRLQQPAR